MIFYTKLSLFRRVSLIFSPHMIDLFLMFNKFLSYILTSNQCIRTRITISLFFIFKLTFDLNKLFSRTYLIFFLIVICKINFFVFIMFIFFHCLNVVLEFWLFQTITTFQFLIVYFLENFLNILSYYSNNRSLVWFFL